MSDLHARLLAAAKAREALARAALVDWPSIIGVVEGSPPFVAADTITIIEHIAANGPDVVLRDCERDLAVLERHRPRVISIAGLISTPTFPNCWACHPKPLWPCEEIRTLAEARGVPIEEAP